MKTKKMITMGVLAMAVWLGLLFQPQSVLAANGEAGMPDTESSRAGENTGQEADAGWFRRTGGKFL